MKIWIFPIDFFSFKHKKSRTRDPQGNTFLNARGGGTKSFTEWLYKHCSEITIVSKTQWILTYGCRLEVSKRFYGDQTTSVRLASLTFSLRAWLENTSFYSFGREPLRSILHPNPSARACPFLPDAHAQRSRRKTIGGNYSNLPVAKSSRWQRQHKVADSQCLWFTRLEEPTPIAGPVFCVCACVSLHHAAPSTSGGENTKSFNSSSEAVFWRVQSCPKAADV